MSILARLMRRESPVHARQSGESYYPHSSPLARWGGSSGGGKTRAGIIVRDRDSLKVAAFYRGVDLLANTEAKLPLKVYRRVGEGKVPDPNHPAYDLLHREPNEWMTAIVYRRLILVHALLHGNHYALIERDGSMRPRALLPLDPRPEVTFPVLRNGVKWIVTGLGTGLERKFKASDVLHILGFGFDGLSGKSVVEWASESIGLSLAAEGFGSAYFANAATPSFLLLHPGKLSKQAAENLKSTFESMHSGIDMAWKTGVIEEGMKAEVISLSAKDSQLLDSRQFQIREMALWLGLPPHKLGDDTRTSLASLEQENQSFLDDSLDPWLVAIEQECEKKLLTERQKGADSHAIEHVRQALLRADMGARGKFYQVALQNPIMTPNEVRARENLNPVEGGDSLYVPLNMTAIGEDPEPEPEADEPPASASRADDIDESIGRLLDEVGGRMARRLATSADRAARNPDTYLDQVDAEAWAARHEEILVTALGPIVSLSRSVRGHTHTVEGLVSGLLVAVSADLVEAASVHADQLAGAVGGLDVESIVMASLRAWLS